MARKKRTTQQKEVQDYRHDTATRKNNPSAGIAAQGKIQNVNILRSDFPLLRDTPLHSKRTKLRQILNPQNH